MNPRLRIFAIIFALLFWLAVAKVCFGDENAAMVAARITGMQKYLAFDRNGKADGAAVFPFDGQWWFYHPDVMSQPTGAPLTMPPPMCAPRFLPNLDTLPRWADVRQAPEDADLIYGCLPRRIAWARKCGGKVLIRNHHAYAVR